MDHRRRTIAASTVRTLTRLVAMFVVIVLASSATRAGSIFDDDWTPPPPPKADAPPSPVTRPPANPATPAKPDDPTMPPLVVTRTPPARVARRPIPAKTDLAQSRKLMSEAFAAELADRSVPARLALARRLVADAGKYSENPVDQFVILSGAIEAAQEGASLRTCFEAADAIAKAFEVDGESVKVDAAIKMPPKSYAANAAENVEAALDMLEPLISAEDFATATKLAAALQTASIGDPALSRLVQQRRKEIDARRAGYERVAAQLEKLRKTPDDPAANLAAGMYYCFENDQWDRGLPMLARGSDPAMKSAATLELSHPTAANALAEIGDGWWDIASKLPAASHARVCRHAAALYAQAAGGLTGLRRALIDKRIADAAALPTGAEPPVGATLYANAPVGEVQQLKHPRGAVNGVVFTPDGKRVISGGGSDNVIRMWDIASAHEIRTFSGHTDKIGRLSISSDGKTLASGSFDHTARTWNVDTGVQTGIFKHDREVAGLALSGSGRYLIVGDFGGKPVIYDLVNGKPVKGFKSEGGYAEAFSASGRYAATGGWNHISHVWDLQGNIREVMTAEQPDQIKALAFSFDETKLISGGHDKAVHLWDLSSGKELRTFAGHSDAIFGLAFCPGDHNFVSGSSDGTVRVWNVATGAELNNFSGHHGKVGSVAVSRDGRLAASAGDDGTVRIWKLPISK